METPLTVPTATEWSPPSTSGEPRRRGSSTRAASALARGRDLREILGMGIAFRPGFRLLDGDVAPVLHLVSERGHARVELATRMAEGPISTPRRPCPRSSGVR